MIIKLTTTSHHTKLFPFREPLCNFHVGFLFVFAALIILKFPSFALKATLGGLTKTYHRTIVSSAYLLSRGQTLCQMLKGGGWNCHLMRIRLLPTCNVIKLFFVHSHNHTLIKPSNNATTVWNAAEYFCKVKELFQPKNISATSKNISAKSKNTSANSKKFSTGTS